VLPRASNYRTLSDSLNQLLVYNLGSRRVVTARFVMRGPETILTAGTSEVLSIPRYVLEITRRQNSQM
jgi:hypothetical protein